MGSSYYLKFSRISLGCAWGEGVGVWEMFVLWGHDYRGCYDPVFELSIRDQHLDLCAAAHRLGTTDLDPFFASKKHI